MKNRQLQRRISLNENYHNGNKHLSNSYNNNNNNNIDIQIFTNTKEPNQVNLNSYLASATVTTTIATTTSSEGHNPCPISASPATDTATEIPQEKHLKQQQQQETYIIMSPTIAAHSSSSISSIATYYSSAKLRKSHSTPILQYCDGSNVGQQAPDSKKLNASCGLTSTHQQLKVQQQHQLHHDQFSRFIGNETGNSVNCNNNSDSNNIANATPESLRFGCTHYKRRAMFVTPCCSKFYKCRFCHDENETSHHFDRKTLTELICSECNTRQKVQEQCEKCGVRFGKYTCLICNLFDDADKQQFHCHGCGICRIGGADNFFHCEVCNMCLPIQLKIDGHRCVENISRSNCPVCLGDIHTSRIPCHIPDCGHLLHKLCFDQLLASGHYTCPTCQTSLIDMTALWEYLDAQALRMPVSLKYENQRVHIFCNDCHKTSKTKFHFIGLKCAHCGAYNTTQDVKRRLSLVTDEPSSA